MFAAFPRQQLYFVDGLDVWMLEVGHSLVEIALNQNFTGKHTGNRHLQSDVMVSSGHQGSS